jgi:hypothetical protein
MASFVVDPLLDEDTSQEELTGFADEILQQAKEILPALIGKLC